eukprot:1194423-Prorocentrum_minimum.AAC.23
MIRTLGSDLGGYSGPWDPAGIQRATGIRRVRYAVSSRLDCSDVLVLDCSLLEGFVDLNL